MKEGEVRFVIKAYDHEGKFIDGMDFIAEDKQDTIEHDETENEFKESVLDYAARRDL